MVDFGVKQLLSKKPKIKYNNSGAMK